MSKTLIAGAFLLATAPSFAQPIDADARWAPAPPQDQEAPPPDNSGPRMVSGGYIGLRGSLALNGNHETTWTPTAPATAIRASYATGAGGSLVLGAYLPLNLRMELEAIYRWQPLSNFAVGGTATSATGKTQIAAPFLNLFWDVPIPDDMGIQPFVGLGVGAAYTRTDIANGGNDYLRQNRWDLAYSFMGGFALPLDERSRLNVLYRWMQVRDAGHKCAASGSVLSVCLDNNIDTSSVDLGYEMDL
jgi:opacity protein-like surface antigen